jgi:hypothetical protein
MNMMPITTYMILLILVNSALKENAIVNNTSPHISAVINTLKILKTFANLA